MKRPTKNVDWSQIFDCLRRSGPEQGVFDTKTKRIVFRYLHDESWESEEVQELAMRDPARFVDLPHPSARERTVWRTEFAGRHALALASTKTMGAFDKALEKDDLHEAWRAYENEMIAALLADWVRRNDLKLELPPELPA